MSPKDLAEALGMISIREMRRLKFAFEQRTGAFAKLGDKYLAVHATQLPFLKIVETQGNWSLCVK